MQGWRWLMVAVLAWGSGLTAAEEAFDATVTLHNGVQTQVRDARLTYSWRELPSQTEGLVSYRDREESKRGLLWSPPGGERVELIPFSRIRALEFDTEVRQLGDSLSFRFIVRGVRLLLTDGTALDGTATLCSEDAPLLWPQGQTVRFPEPSEAMRIERRSVSLQGKIRDGGEETAYVFVFPSASQEGIQAVVKRRQETFPRRIEFVPAPPLVR